MTIPPPLFPSRWAAKRAFGKDGWLTRRVREALPEAESKHAERLAAALRANRHEQHHDAELHAVLIYMSRMNSLWQSDPLGLADLIVRLRCDRVRDELYEIAAGRTDRLHPTTVPDADAVLYGLLTTATSGPDQAHAATLTALTIYTRYGDGTTAEVLLDKACTADPEHHVAKTLHLAVIQQLAPRDVAATFLRSHTQH
ncbi:DUF4192 family protein [Nocardia sp. NBC_01327]|uniref:DUF4192 family protein n=1 Tax=Nocardia sp. NBC_01327 TaxID=2903593 RepID=UPI002E161B29|nr:DUF4192 domain-containing protein [Nocardia sp. NBC_01327]